MINKLLPGIPYGNMSSFTSTHLLINILDGINFKLIVHWLISTYKGE